MIEKTVELHPAQGCFRSSDALYRGFVGGRGVGKSWVGAYDMLCRAASGFTYLVASPTYILMSDTTLPTLTAIALQLGFLRSTDDIKITPRPNMTLYNGAVIRFRSAEEPDKMRGPNLAGCWLDEASLMDEEAYTVAIGSLREGGKQGWLSATFTPKGMSHWTYEVFAKGRVDTQIFQAHTRENPFNPEGFADTLANQYSPQLARQELGGEFVTMEGAEWPPEYFEDSIWFDEWPKDIQVLVLSLDPSKGKDAKSGDYSAYVLVGICRAGVLWVDADMARRPVNRMVQDGISLFRERRPAAMVVEVNQFQELLGAEFLRQAAAIHMHLPLYGIDNRVNKQVRIRRIGTYLGQRRIRFNAKSLGAQLLVQQLRDFPIGEHDDGPDSCEQGIRMLLHLMGESIDQGQPEILRAG